MHRRDVLRTRAGLVQHCGSELVELISISNNEGAIINRAFQICYFDTFWGVLYFLPKTTHDLSLMFTDVFANFSVFFFLFSVCWHKVIAVHCGSCSLWK